MEQRIRGAASRRVIEPARSDGRRKLIARSR